MAGDRRGSYRNGIRTRDQIVATAMTAFAERGFHGLSMRQLAAEVGISPAALRRHFESKDDLLTTVLLEAWKRETTSVQAASGREPAGLGLWTTLTAVMDYHAEHRGLLRLFVRLAAEATSPEHPAHERMAARYREVIDLFASGLMVAAEEGAIGPLTADRAESEARAIAAFMDGIEIQWLLDPSFDMTKELAGHLDTTLARLRAEPEPVA